MLKSINKRYLIFGLVILIVFTFFLGNNYRAIYIMNFMAFFAYYATINQCLDKPTAYFTKQRLGFIVLFYLLIFVTINKFLSFFYTGNFYVFSLADAVLYHEESTKMSTLSFFDSISYFLKNHSSEDLGIVLVFSTLYRIVSSQLILAAFYIIVGIITSFSIFRISRNFMSVKYSFICSLTYSISSFVIWFHSSVLKESFMVMLIILFFDYYYSFLRLHKTKYLIFASSSLLPILLFRPALALFCVGSIALGVLLSRKRGIVTYLLIISVILVTVFLSPYLKITEDRFLSGGTEQMLVNQEANGLIKGGLVFTYSVNALAAAIGPLPSVLPNTKQLLSFYSIGVIYRVFLAVAFWFGIYYSIKNRAVFIYPIIFFVFKEMISLVYILEGLELRKSLPHFPFVFIISFWFLDSFDRGKIGTKQTRGIVKNIWNISSIVLMIIIIYWNTR